MNKSDITRDYFMLKGPLKKKGYDWWWHSFTARNRNTGEERSFFIEYFTCNPLIGRNEPVYGQLPENIKAGKNPSYIMVKAGWWGAEKKQLHRFFGWNEAEIGEKNGFYLSAEDCFVSEKMMTGSIHVSEEDAKNHPEYMSDEGSMQWKIEIEKITAFHVGYGASKLFRWLNAFEMFWHAEGMKTKYSGTIIADGAIYDVLPDTSYGYADKNWGKDFTSPWVWLSSNDLTSLITKQQLKNSVFNIGGGRPKVFGIPLNHKLLSDFWYEGKDYEFNFSKFWTLTRTKFKCIETEKEIIWRIWQENRSNVMKVEIHCNKDEMLWINYEAPNGKKLHNRLWNGGTGHGIVKLYRKCNGSLTLIDIVKAEHVGCEYGIYDKK